MNSQICASHGAPANTAPTNTAVTAPNSLLQQNPLSPIVVGYARVSTDLQREKESIRTQVECIERECLSRGWRLGEVYCDDGVSGTLPLEARPAEETQYRWNEFLPKQTIKLTPCGELSP